MKQLVVATGIIERRGKVLVGLRYSPHDPKAHGLWQICGGKVEPGESPERAAVREVREETGYRVKVLSHEARVTNVLWRYHREAAQVVVLTYHCKVVGGKLLKHLRENSEWKWIGRRDVKKLKFTPGTADALQWWFSER